jgi:long-chain acyl-CoA synthetase
MNVAQLALDNMERFGRFTATYFEGRGHTNHEEYARACRLSSVLAEHGARRGDRVVLMMPNSPDVKAAFIAAWKLGAVIIPVTPMWNAREARYVLADSRAELALVSPELASRMSEAAAGIAGFREVLVIGETNVEGAIDIAREVDSAAPFDGLVDCEPGDVALLLYTSGTTGAPKGVMLSHEALLFVADSVYERNRGLGQIRTMLVLPLSHIYGVLLMCLGYRLGSVSRILRQFDARQVLEAIQDFKVERLSVVPTMLSYLINHPERESYDVSSLVHVNSGGAPLSESVRVEFERLFNCRVVQGYGLSETGALLSGYEADEAYVPGSVGRPAPGVEACVMDFDNRQLPAGAVGEICTRGKHVMNGYFNKEEATRETIIDGWLHTGDIGYIDDQGYVFITDRKKDLIIKGGENISPREIEECIYSHKAIAEASVFGLPDEFYGEMVAAAVVLRPGHSVTEEELKEHISGYVTRFKVPSKIVFLDALPKNHSGKILKRTLRELFCSS